MLTSSIDNLDDFVQDNESGLQTCKLNESLDSSGICLSTPLNLLAAFAQTGQAKVIDLFLLVSLERWQEDTRYVLLLRPNSELCILDRLLHLKTNISANSVGDFGQREGGDLHDSTHLPLGLIYAL